MALDTKNKWRVVLAVGVGTAISFAAKQLLVLLSDALPNHLWLAKGVVIVLYAFAMTYWAVVPILRATGHTVR